jgi:hypothetical protein
VAVVVAALLLMVLLPETTLLAAAAAAVLVEDLVFLVIQEIQVLPAIQELTVQQVPQAPAEH